MSKTIVFICTGNTCRSPLAEAGMRRLASEAGLDCSVTSAGLAVFGAIPASENARIAATEAGLDLSTHVSRPFAKAVALGSDLIVTMTQRHKEGILHKIPALEGKVLTLAEFAGEGPADVPDPAGGDIEEYRSARDRILQYLQKAVQRMTEERP